MLGHLFVTILNILNGSMFDIFFGAPYCMKFVFGQIHWGFRLAVFDEVRVGQHFFHIPPNKLAQKSILQMSLISWKQKGSAATSSVASSQHRILISYTSQKTQRMQKEGSKGSGFEKGNGGKLINLSSYGSSMLWYTEYGHFGSDKFKVLSRGVG